MAQVFPTKSNLMSTKKSLDLAKLGYDLLDRKRNILVHEMMQLIDKASKIQREIDEIYSKAYLALPACERHARYVRGVRAGDTDRRVARY